MSEEAFNPIWLFVIIPLGFIVVFPIFWVFVVWLIGAAGGWRRMAQHYRATNPAAGRKFLNQYGFVSGSRYGNALNITTNDAGMYIETVPLFAINHPPLFIPWHDIHSPKPVTFRWWQLIEVEVGHPRVGRLRLPPIVFEQSEGRRVLEGMAGR